MDPLCHTLVGASLGATGLARRTRHGNATLLVAANLPDVDGIAYFFGPAAYAVRRGATHGLAAMLLLPCLLAAAVWGLSRIRGGPPASFRWLLALSAVGVATHPALDWLNTYGMRWLMPFVDRWYYGDTLFIADGIVWGVLLAGLLLSRRLDTDSLHWFQRPASVALGVLCLYIGASFAITQLAARAAIARFEQPPLSVMASPVALHPLRRAIVLEYPDEYRFAHFGLGANPTVDIDGPPIAKPDPILLARARRERVGRWFLHWARFPYAVPEPASGGTVVYLADARYVRDIADAPRGFGVVRLNLAD